MLKKLLISLTFIATGHLLAKNEFFISTSNPFDGTFTVALISGPKLQDIQILKTKNFAELSDAHDPATRTNHERLYTKFNAAQKAQFEELVNKIALMQSTIEIERKAIHAQYPEVVKLFQEAFAQEHDFFMLDTITNIQAEIHYKTVLKRTSDEVPDSNFYRNFYLKLSSKEKADADAFLKKYIALSRKQNTNTRKLMNKYQDILVFIAF